MRSATGRNIQRSPQTSIISPRYTGTMAATPKPSRSTSARLIDENSFGPHHPEIATNLINLALMYKAQGRYAEAEPLYKRCLAIRERALDSQHLLIAIVLDHLAELYRAQGRRAAAEPLYKRCLAIVQPTLHPEYHRFDGRRRSTLSPRHIPCRADRSSRAARAFHRTRR